jgi:hypothetical protein
MGELSKFDELRLKTDHELWKLLNDVVDRGLIAAREALTRADDPTSASRSYSTAKRAQEEVSRLFPLSEMTRDDRSQLQSRLDRLSCMIEALDAMRPRIGDDKDSAVALACDRY